MNTGGFSLMGATFFQITATQSCWGSNINKYTYNYFFLEITEGSF